MIDGRRSIAAIAALLALAAGATSARGAATSAQRIAPRASAAAADYWSAKRMAAARPADLVLGRGGRLERAAARSAVDISQASASYPGNVHGKVFFTIAGGSDPGDFICSATVVASNQHTLVWTAGHCVNDSQFGGGRATNWVFVPGYREGARPFGTWPAAELLTTEGWAQDGDLRQDLGAARLVRDAQGRGIEDVLGARPIDFGRSRSQAYRAFGYPATPGLLAPTFDGQHLYGCDSPVTGSDNPPGNGPETLQIDCDMTGGASGGGWVNADGAVNGLTSYGYAADPLHLYGPYFGGVARDLHEAAGGPPIECAAAAVTNLGGAGSQDFAGTGGADAFLMAGGADAATGLGAADKICGGGGSDRLAGGGARDVLRGGTGGDRLEGGPGTDLCVGGPGRDRARGCERRRSIP